jgi:hypothetical protein
MMWRIKDLECKAIGISLADWLSRAHLTKILDD